MPISPDCLITNPDECLHRNAHPDFIQDGRISTQVFNLKTDDEGLLSLQQNAKAAPEIAYQRYTTRGFQSGGIWSITIAECELLTLQTYDDPIDGDDSHALTDLTAYSRSQARKLTDKLTVKARERGCQYVPPE
jgi:hypothetical protein